MVGDRHQELAARVAVADAEVAFREGQLDGIAAAEDDSLIFAFHGSVLDVTVVDAGVIKVEVGAVARFLELLPREDEAVLLHGGFLHQADGDPDVLLLDVRDAELEGCPRYGKVIGHHEGGV